MTKYEQKNKINERFIITYGIKKVNYLKDKGFFYLFTGFNTNSHGQFWVYDATPEIKYALDHYLDERLDEDNNQ